MQTIRSLKKIFSKRQKLYGLLTSYVRLKPDFIIIGAQRCGTTSLYNYLIQHPCVAPALEKEVHFFDNNFRRGVLWYRAHFPSLLSKLRFEQTHRWSMVTGESTPYYLFHPRAPERTHKVVPNAKLIIMLRNPVDRAYSHFQHEKRLGNEFLSFEEAIEREKQRLAGERERMVEDRSYYSFNYQHYSYLARGIYVDHVKTWTSLFSQEQIMTLCTEKLQTDLRAVYSKVIRFLGLPPFELKHPRKFNVGHYEPMRNKTRRFLVDYFNPHNQRLYDYLDMDFDWQE